MYLIALIIFSFVQFSEPKVQKIPIIDFQTFEKNYLLQKDNDTLFVINFWATWCKPCVGELPYFESAHQQFEDKPVKIILVSLDFASNYEDKLIPFVKAKNLKSKIFLLDDTKYNSWIDKVSPEWSGAIPATVFIRKGVLLEFFEAEMSQEEINTTINHYL